MRGVTLDPAQRLPIYFRVARYGVLTLTFIDSAGAPYDVSDKDFRLLIFYKENSEKILYEPAEITVSPITNTISFEFTTLGTLDIKQGQYYWQLIVDSEKTWLNGPAFGYKGEADYDRVEELDPITINIGSVVITVTVEAGGGTGGNIDGLPFAYQGDWEGSTNLAPTVSASGAMIKAGHIWNVNSNTTTLLGPDGGIIPKGNMLLALVDSPGANTADDTKWKIIAGVN